MAWMRITGEDARSFLQGQFTQQLQVARNQAVAYGLWLNQKGKVLADSQVLLTGPEEVFVWSEATPQEVIMERLDAYIIADDVVIESLEAGWVRTTVAGRGASEWIAAQVGDLPAAGCFARVGEGLVFRGRHGEIDSWEWLTPAGAEPDVSGIQMLDAEELKRARIVAGVPLIPVEVGSGDLPNEAGLEAEAISYTKGCYLGQEVMARLKSMGRVRRRLVRVSGPGPLPDCPASLWQGGKSVGELRGVVAVGGSAGGGIGLAMVNLFSLKAEDGLALSSDGAADWRVEDSV